MRRAAFAALLIAGSAHAADLELLHGWTSGSEVAMVAELAAAAKRGGVDLKPTAVAGSSNANTLLKDRVLFGSDYPLITPDRWMKDFDEAGFRDEVKPLILKSNAMRLLKLG